MASITRLQGHGWDPFKLLQLATRSASSSLWAPTSGDSTGSPSDPTSGGMEKQHQMPGIKVMRTAALPTFMHGHVHGGALLARQGCLVHASAPLLLSTSGTSTTTSTSMPILSALVAGHAKSDPRMESARQPRADRWPSERVPGSPCMPSSSMHLETHRSFFNQSGGYGGGGIGGTFQRLFSGERGGTNAVIALNVAAFIIASMDHRWFQNYAQNNYLVAQGQWYRLLTAAFLHSSVLHLLGNMLAIHWLGPNLEQAAGRSCFAVVYLTSAVSGGLAHYYLGAFNAVGVGSSGAIAGLFSAFITYKLMNRSTVGFTSHDLSWVGQIVALNVALSMLMGGSISHVAHLGGLVGGAAAMMLFGPRWVWEFGSLVNRPRLPWFRE